MDDRNFQNQNKNNEANQKNTFWKSFGLVVVAFALATLTVLIINL